MTWPTPQDYNEAIQNPRLNFVDPELAAGQPELTPLGLPRPVTGNFASVYRVRCDDKDWAVRCFWREYADMQDRYLAISRHLQSARLPHTVGCEYIARGIKVRGTWYPVLKMEWVEGELLSTHLERHLHEPSTLRGLTSAWAEMVKALEGAGCAHGDLQHGNVMVVNGKLKLVDYDGMYVPALAGRGSHEVGHPNYQHPRRSGADFGPWLDRFPALVIYLSLLALSIDPDLWQQTQAGDECLLFRRVDFEQPDSSPTLALLARLQDPKVRPLVHCLRQALRDAPSRVPDLENVRGGGARIRSPGQTVLRLRPAQEMVPEPGPAAHPPWLADHLVASGPTRGSALAWEPRLRLAVLSPIVLCVIVAAAVPVGFPPLPAALMALAALLLALSLGAVSYYQHPTVKSMHEILAVARRHRSAAQRLEYEINELERERAESEQRTGEQIARLRARRDAVAKGEREELDIAGDRLKAVIGDTDRRLRELDRVQHERLRTALEELQRRHVREQLGACHLRTAEIEELGWLVKTRLWASGIRSAADVTAERMRAIQGVGKAELQAVATWRVDAELRARRSKPANLPTEQSERIVKPLESAREEIVGERERARLRKAELAAAIERRCKKQYRSLDAEIAHLHERQEEQVRVIAGEIDTQNKALERELALLGRAQRQLEPYACVTVQTFLRALVSSVD